MNTRSQPPSTEPAADPTNMKRVLRATVSWSVRGLVVGGIGGGTTEKAYCNAAVKIRAGQIKTGSELLTELSSIIPSDIEFETAFKTARVVKHSLARYYLNALERGKMNTAEPELVPNSNEEEVNLEHVLPKRATATEWPQFSPDERRDYVVRMGNLALLKKTQNSSIGNKPFSDKQPVLAASVLELTKEIGQKPDWTPAEIDARQATLAELAVSVWKRSP